MAQVICVYCGKKFSRDKEPYVKIKNRYAHATCAQSKGDVNLSIITPVKCIYCKKILNKSDPDCIILDNNRFAHAKCYEYEQTREKTDEERLYDYIKALQHTTYVLPFTRKQIKEFIEKYNYSYNGILRAIEYGVNITHKMKFDEKNSTLGYIPYIYQEAQRYFYQLHMAEQQNAQSLETYTPKKITVKITPPQRTEKKLNPFSKLLQEGIDG